MKTIFTSVKQLFLLSLGLLLASCSTDAQTDVPVPAPEPQPAVDTAFFYEQCLYAPGDYGSANWRIPAIISLPDGSLLAVNDKRKYNEGDLPQDIDIVARRSTDHGRTWTEPVTIAAGTGVKHGYGDPALVLTASGDVICAFAGGNGYFASTEADPIRSYVCRSSDGGLTWTEPEDITSILWGSQAENSGCRAYCGSFFSSGNGLRLTRGEHAGRIMFACPMRLSGNVSYDRIVYSDDEGYTWHVSSLAYGAGDEAKLMELADGRVLISVRRKGERGYNISNDGGLTWGTTATWPEMTTNACNGEMLRVKAVDRGDTCNLLLHSIPNSMDRENVSIFLSYDEGQTWQTPVLLFDGPSVYSSMTLLDDGTIGVYLEKNPSGACELWFQNFSLRWLLDQVEAQQ